MIKFVANQIGEDGTPLRAYFSGLYQGGALPALPWGSEQFDCILVWIDHGDARGFADSFSTEIVKCSVDYVQTTGVHAELIHDYIDEAAVLAGIQGAVGDGFPMTTWHEDALTLDEIAEVAGICFGGADYVLCLVVGSPDDHNQFNNLLRKRLSAAG
jgi:hypothetical protein